MDYQQMLRQFSGGSQPQSQPGGVGDPGRGNWGNGSTPGMQEWNWTDGQIHNSLGYARPTPGYQQQPGGPVPQQPGGGGSMYEARPSYPGMPDQYGAPPVPQQTNGGPPTYNDGTPMATTGNWNQPPQAPRAPGSPGTAGNPIQATWSGPARIPMPAPPPMPPLGMGAGGPPAPPAAPSPPKPFGMPRPPYGGVQPAKPYGGRPNMPGAMRRGGMSR